MNGTERRKKFKVANEPNPSISLTNTKSHTLVVTKRQTLKFVREKLYTKTRRGMACMGYEAVI